MFKPKCAVRSGVRVHPEVHPEGHAGPPASLREALGASSTLSEWRPDALVPPIRRSTVNLLLIEESELDADRRAVITGDRARHLVEVLRVGVGSRIRCGVVDWSIGTGTVLEASQGRVVLEYAGSADGLPARPQIDLLLAMPRPKVMNRLWAQLAALGVRNIMISNAWKVERPYFDSHVLEPQFIHRRLIEGLAQAGDIHMPRVSIHRRFKVLIEDDLDSLFDAGLRLALDPGAEDVLRPPSYRLDRVLAAVGPEGGWTPYELDLMDSHGFRRVRISDRTLRSDTACIAAVSILASG